MMRQWDKLIKFIFLFFMTSCSYHKPFTGSGTELSGSPCIDGTALNMEENGCKGFYWGMLEDGSTLKVRCVYYSEQNFWVNSSFYFALKGLPIEQKYLDMTTFCEDRFVISFSDH